MITVLVIIAMIVVIVLLLLQVGHGRVAGYLIHAAVESALTAIRGAASAAAVRVGA